MRYLIILLICLRIVSIVCMPKEKPTLKISRKAEVNRYAHPYYFYWDKRCWGKALDCLNDLRKDKRVVVAHMKIGWGNYENTGREAHAWVEYTLRENGKDHTIAYDPTFDKLLTDSIPITNWR